MCQWLTASRIIYNSAILFIDDYEAMSFAMMDEDPDGKTFMIYTKALCAKCLRPSVCRFQALCSARLRCFLSFRLHDLSASDFVYSGSRNGGESLCPWVSRQLGLLPRPPLSTDSERTHLRPFQAERRSWVNAHEQSSTCGVIFMHLSRS